MATADCVTLLLSAKEFAGLSAMDQRSRLVTYYSDWFKAGAVVNAVDNIRATQRLGTHAKVMNLSVGAVLQAILSEASGQDGDAIRYEDTPGMDEEPAPEPERTPGYDLLGLMTELEPAAANGALVSLRDLRRAATPDMDKPTFDAAVIKLASDGLANLHRHDYPGSLTDGERAAMVPDDRGSYYIGVARRV